MAQPRQVRGSLRPEILALPHRDQRLPRHAQGQGAPRAADGHGPIVRADRGKPECPRRDHVAGTHPAQPDRARPRSGRCRRGERIDSTGVRGRAAAAAGQAARGAHPPRGPGLAGHRGGRAPGQLGAVREQRPAARASHACQRQCAWRGRREPRAAPERGGPRDAGAIRGRVRGLRPRRADLPHPGRRQAVHAAVRHVAERPR